MDSLGYLLGLHVTPTNEQGCAQVAQLTQRVQEATGQFVEVAFVDQGYTGAQVVKNATGQGMRLKVVKLFEAKKGSLCCLVGRWSSAALPGRRVPSLGTRL